MLRLPSLIVLISGCLIFAAAAPSRAETCEAQASVMDKVVCNSPGLKALDLRVHSAAERLKGILAAPVARAFDTDARAWRAGRESCATEKLPQQCLEWSYYGRLELLDAMTGLFAGPRQFGDPLRICWRISESEAQADRCLAKRRAEARTAVELMAAGVEAVLKKRDETPGAAGDALESFGKAQAAFSAYADANCRSEAAALGEGVGRTLGEQACIIRKWQARAIEIEKLMPDRRVHWSERTAQAAQMLDACLGALPEGIDPAGARLVDVTDMGSESGPRLRVSTGRSKRIDCIAPKTQGGPPRVVPVAQDDIGIVEGFAVFTPDPGEPPHDACHETTRFTPPSGGKGGWMSYRVC